MGTDIVDFAEFSTTTTSDVRGRVSLNSGLHAQFALHALSAALDDGGLDRAPYRSAAIGEDLIAQQRRMQEIGRRVVELEALYFDDFGRELNAESRTAFECFMRFNPWFGYPLLGAEESGVLVATWVKDRECLSIRFVDRYRLHFALTTVVNGQPECQWGNGDLATFPAERHPQAKRIAST